MTHSIAEHYPFPVEALDLAQARVPITHDVKWEFRSHDDSGRPCLSENSFQAVSLEHARELEALCKADQFKLNVRVVARGGGK
jgi:hypothetical protein